MEEKKETAVLCTCGGHCMHLGMKHNMARKIFIIVALLVTFCLGAQFGEIKGELRSLRGGHYGMMHDYGYDNNGYYPYNNFRGGMMGAYNVTIPNATQNTPSPTTPAKP